MGGDFGVAVGVGVFDEDAADGEGDAADGDGLVDGCGVGAVDFLGHGSDDDGDLGVGGGVLVVEEAAGDDPEIADLLVLRADAEQSGFLGDAAADGDAVVVLEHGRAGDDAWDLVVDGLHVLAGHGVGGGDVVGAHDLSAGVLHFDLVGAEAGDGIERVLAASEADGGDQNDGGRADDHAEHGEQEAGLGGGEAIEGEVDGFAEGDGGARAAEGRIEAGGGCGHRQKKLRKQYRSVGRVAASRVACGVGFRIEQGPSVTMSQQLDAWPAAADLVLRGWPHRINFREEEWPSG